MKKLIFLLLTAALLFSSTAGAEVLTFDDLSGCSGNCSSIDQHYGGFSWDSLFGYANTTWSGYDGSGYEYGNVSGDYAAYNMAGVSVFVGNEEFDFIGAYLTSAWREGLTVEVKGMNSGQELYATTVSPDLYSPTWFQFDYTGIDELVFTSSGGTDVMPDSGRGTHFVMDDFTFNSQNSISPAVAPEPVSSMLFAAGGVTFGIRRLFQRRKNI